MLTRRDYENALMSQTAPNLSGIVRSLAEVTNRIWDEGRAKGAGTDYVNTHPICVLYVEQFAHLVKYSPGAVSYSEAHRVVSEAIAEDEARTAALATAGELGAVLSITSSAPNDEDDWDEYHDDADICKACGQIIKFDGQVWIDKTLGDVCGMDGDNSPHMPTSNGCEDTQ
jgi:hypothetical protein